MMSTWIVWSLYSLRLAALRNWYEKIYYKIIKIPGDISSHYIISIFHTYNTKHCIMVAWLASYPHLKWDGVWKPHAHFLVFEAWFTNAQSRLLGATNVCQMRLFLAHSQSFQLYLMTYVARQKFYAEEGDRLRCVAYSTSSSCCTLPALWLVPYLRRKFAPWSPGCLAARIESRAQGSMGKPRLASWGIQRWIQNVS